ncbi:hypothetical protein IKQ26_01390 [bacterium]|nr:hypothetical protein [bacterium]
MENLEAEIKDLIGKDESKARPVAEKLINTSDIELFKALICKTDFLFDFVKNNVAKRIEGAVNKNNFKNIINFFTVYSSEYDDLFAGILAKHASQDLTDEIFEMLQSGTNEQKAYCAKYFSLIPDTVSIEDLQKYAFSDFEPLALNSAQALGIMRDDISYDIALSNLESEDDFEKLQAVKFFTAYEKNPPLNEIFEAMKKSNMPENIAGEIPYIANLTTLFSQDEYKKNVLITFDNILSGLGEILPLSQIFQFELFEVTELLINTNKTENKYRSKIAQILLKERAKIKMFCENEEYIFDEDKNTKQELCAVQKLLQSQSKEFWQEQSKEVLKELDHCRHRICAALEVIIEYNLKDAAEKIKSLLTHENEIVVCKCTEALKEFNMLSEVNKEEVLSRIQNENLKALIESYWRE